MIRFIDLRGQDTGSRFAYWDTVKDCFLTVNGDQAWSLWSEFEEGYWSDAVVVQPLDRFKNVTPEWAFIESPNMDKERFSDDFICPETEVGQCQQQQG